jgi:exonuclease SbcC
MITRGISLFNASRGGVSYQFLFSDEKDGRLTDERKKEFMAVKRRVLELGGFTGEYFISHTREIQEMADTAIDLEEFVAAPVHLAPAEPFQEALV